MWVLVLGTRSKRSAMPPARDLEEILEIAAMPGKTGWRPDDGRSSEGRHRINCQPSPWYLSR